MRDAFGQPQSALVLGGTSEIALNVMTKLAMARCKNIVLAVRNTTAGEEAADTLRALGATVSVISMEGTRPETAAGTVEAGFDAAGGHVDLVIIAAAILGEQDDFDDDPAATAELFTVNTTWPAAAMAALRPRLLAQGSGHVAVFSSVAAVRPRRSLYTYSSSKSGLDAFTTGWAESVRSAGIKVQIIRPGFVHSKMTKGKSAPPFTTDADQAAANIVAGLSSNKLIIWSPPVLQWVFLLLRHLPQALWRKMPG
jgi:decaprenylphospho-beta-D-erythro-pentofuranosid-2-ulose 2-reductase